MGHMLTSLYKEVGQGPALAIAIFLAFIFLLKWVLKNNEKNEERMHARELKSWEVSGAHQKAIQDHTAQAKSFHQQVQDAHKYQREEHKEMVVILGRINGYKQ